MWMRFGDGRGGLIDGFLDFFVLGVFVLGDWDWDRIGICIGWEDTEVGMTLVYLCNGT